MSTVIKDGTIVTADRTYKADVLVENGKITKIGEGLSARTLDATGCYVMPAGSTRTHLEMPFMGLLDRRFRIRHRAALSAAPRWWWISAFRRRTSRC